MSCVIDHKRRRSKEKEKEKEKNYWMQLTAYITARTSDCVSLQSNGSFTIKKAVVTISTVPKKYDNAVTERFAGYFFKTGAWRVSITCKEFSGRHTGLSKLNQRK